MALEIISQFVRTANRCLEVSDNGLSFTLTLFFEKILQFVRQISKSIALFVYVSIDKVTSHF